MTLIIERLHNKWGRLVPSCCARNSISFWDLLFRVDYSEAKLLGVLPRLAGREEDMWLHLL